MRSLFRSILVLFRVVQAPDYYARFTCSMPVLSDVEPGCVVIVRQDGKTKWACLRCPCATGALVRLSLNENQSPHWYVSVDFLARPTILPSIHQTDGCRCHYWIKSGLHTLAK